MKYNYEQNLVLFVSILIQTTQTAVVSKVMETIVFLNTIPFVHLLISTHQFGFFKNRSTLSQNAGVPNLSLLPLSIHLLITPSFIDLWYLSLIPFYYKVTLILSILGVTHGDCMTLNTSKCTSMYSSHHKWCFYIKKSIMIWVFTEKYIILVWSLQLYLLEGLCNRCLAL